MSLWTKQLFFSNYKLRMIKYNLDDEDIQKMVDELQEVLYTKYKKEIEDIDEHFVHTLTQNFVIGCKNENMDFEKMMEDLKI